MIKNPMCGGRNTVVDVIVEAMVLFVQQRDTHTVETQFQTCQEVSTVSLSEGEEYHSYLLCVCSWKKTS